MLIKSKRFKTIAVALSLVLILGGLAPQALAARTSSDIDYSLRKAIDYYYISAPSTDWKYALGLAAAGDSGALSFQVGNPDLSVITDIANRIIGLIASRQDPTAVEINGKLQDLVQMLAASQNPDGHFGPADATLNTTVWGVIALDMAANNGVAGANNCYNIDQAMAYIASCQTQEGGFDESGWGVDADSTAHVLLAVAPHLPADSPVVTKAIGYLKSKQLESGGIDNWGDNPSSTAAVIEALIALGQDPQGPEWTKKGNNLVDSLLSFQAASGGFIQDTNWGPLDHTPYALLALADLANKDSKYQRPLIVTPADIHLFAESGASLPAGHDADLVIQTKNLAADKKPVLVIAVLYDSQGKMVQYAYASREIAPGDTERFGLGFGLPTSSGYQVKIMVWDSWENRHPMANSITIPVF